MKIKLKGFSVKATPEQARRLAAAPGVRYVQADTVFRVSGTQPNPPSWGIDRVDGAKDGSYAYPNDGSGVTAYIADTGLYRQHSDFGSRASAGYDFIDNDADSADCHGHGTHVAGTLGGSADRALDDAVAGVINAGVPVAVAAGNHSKDACNTSPARLPAAITLGSTDSNDARSSFSNYGSCLDLFTPGGSIVSTKMGGGTQTMSGTSMATPHTAGAAAIYLSAHADATPQQVRDALVDNAQSGVVTGAGSGSPNTFLNVTKLGAPTRPGEPVADFAAQCSASAASCAFDASASKDPDGSIASYAWEFGDGAKAEGVKPSHEYAAAGTYSVKLTVTDDSGRTATVTKPVTAGTTQPPSGTPPTAAFSVSCWYQDCSFDASASKDSDGSIASYKWKFGDSATGTGAGVAHRYPAGQRSYTAELTVTDNSGLTATASRRIDCYAFGTGQSLCFAS